MPLKSELRRLNTTNDSPLVKSTRLRQRSRKGGRVISPKKARFMQTLKKRFRNDPKLFKMNPQVVLYRDPRSPNKLPFCCEENEPARSTKLVKPKRQIRSVHTMSRRQRILISMVVLMVAFFVIVESNSRH